MAYDYSSENRRLELPNPYRVENVFLFACAVVTVVGGLAALMWARAALQAQERGGALLPLAVGIGLVAGAVALATVGARRLRFFFGRGRPHSLADEVDIGANGNSGSADELKAMLRQGGLLLPEPQGALNGLLYHVLPRLITAPLAVQSLAQRQFFNALAFLATFLSFFFAWGIFGTEASRPWVSLAYFVFGAVMLLKPLVAGERARLGPGPLVGLVVAAIVGPVIIGSLAPALPPLHFDLRNQALTLLLCALLAVTLILGALHAQVDASPPTERSCEQRTVSMNGPPGALLTELDRSLQAAWVENIPNRRYTRIEPATPGSAGSGRFAGEMLEESQPMPLAGTAPVTFASAMSSPRHVWLVVIDLCGTLLVLLGTMSALIFVREADPARVIAGHASLSSIGYAAVFGALAAFCFKAAGEIWGRFNFESVLLWVEMQGTWQASRIGTGNQFSSQLQTSNEIVRVESMTLRVWRARIESVAFGKDGERRVTAMYGTSREAAELADELERHASQQSVFVAPRASEDPRRIEALRASEALLGGRSAEAAREALGGAGTAPGLLPRANAGPPDGSGSGAGPARFCSACGARAAAGSRFCSACGAPLAPPT